MKCLKGGVCANEVLKDRKVNKVMSLLEKVEVLEPEREMRIAMVGCCCGVNE
jgi:hypothetical protein